MIDYDAGYNGDTVSNANSLTYSHTCTGVNRILFVLVEAYVSGPGSTGDIVTGVTYNGVAMTLVDKQNGADVYNRYQYLYKLENPASGANNIVVSASSSSFRLVASSVSYTGARQTGQPDNHTTNQTASASSLATSLTPVADKCWMVSGVCAPLVTPSASTGITDRAAAASFNSRIGDSNGPITPAASYSMTWAGGSSSYNVLQASFAPVPDSAFLAFM